MALVYPTMKNYDWVVLSVLYDQNKILSPRTISNYLNTDSTNVLKSIGRLNSLKAIKEFPDEKYLIIRFGKSLIEKKRARKKYGVKYENI
jgi:hypothetical protein